MSGGAYPARTMASDRAPDLERLADHVIGRERALAAVDRFLASLDRPAVLLVEGSAGIGKTTLWLEATQRATALGMRVLACSAAQAEVSLAFNGLVDLFGPVADAELASLAPAQRDALAVALRRRVPDAGMPDALSVSAGVRAALAGLAANGPLVLAIDDAQWLDPSTLAALAYLIRRLEVEPIGFIVARRPREPGLSDDLFSGDRLRVDSVQLEALSLSSLHHIIRSRTGHVLSRPMLHRVAEASGGNPFFAIELAQALIDAGQRPSSGEPIPAPATIVDLTARRIRRLPPDAREVLLVVASLSSPSEPLVARVLGRSPAAGIEAAREEGILEPDGESLQFDHPLFAESVLRLARREDRRRIHARIAEELDEPEERARHLALAVDPPDDDTAAALDAGAAAARARGALQAAAELLDQARRFSGPTDFAAAHRRAFEAAELWILAGDRGAARDLLRDLVAAARSPLRERAVGLLAEILVNDGEISEAESLLRDARSTATDPMVAGRLDLDLAYVSLLRLEPGGAARLAKAARTRLETAGDQALLAEALAYEGLALLLNGEALVEDDLATALRFEDRHRPPYLGLPPSGTVGLIRVLAGDHDGGRPLLAAAHDNLDALGDDCDLAHVLLWASFLELRAGRLAEAAAHARQAATMAESTGSELLRGWSVAQAALVEASRGLPAAVDALLAEATERGFTPSGLVSIWFVAARGVAALAAGSPAAATAIYAPIVAAAPDLELPDPVLGFYVPDAVEAFASAGDVAIARSLLKPFVTAAESRDRPWARAAAARAGAVILAMDGAPDAALEQLRLALELFATANMPFEQARTLLLQGQIERRQGARRAARSSFERSSSIFMAAGATGWAARATAELQRVPGRRPEPEGLTPSEKRVAELSGAGRTNREVATLLYVSPKTVEANLTRIYRKLEISTRAELGAWVAARNDEGHEPIP